MKESLLSLAKLLAEDEKFSKDFSSLKSVDEQYDFAQKSVKGYTKEEFEKFLSELEMTYKLKSEVSPESIKNVSGGINKYTKVAAMAMLALTAAGGMSNFTTGIPQTYAMTGENSTTNLDFDNLFRDNTGQELFNYSNSSEKGELRKQIYDKLVGSDSDAFADQVRNYYNGSNRFFKWIRSPGRTWTGWKFSFSEQQEKTVRKEFESGEYQDGEIMLWLSKKFEEGYFLYYNWWGNLTLSNSSISPATTLNYNWFKAENPDTKLANEDFDEVIQDLEAKLNQARAFRGACEKAGKVELANYIMGSI